MQRYGERRTESGKRLNQKVRVYLPITSTAQRLLMLPNGEVKFSEFIYIFFKGGTEGREERGGKVETKEKAKERKTN